MSTTYQIEVQVRDPLIARDGRPFGTGQGSRMRSLDWLLPSVLAGSFRSLVGKTAGGFDPSMVQSLKDLEIAGPFPVHESHLYFPTPRDALLQSVGPGQEKHLSIRPTPLGNGEGTDLPNNLQPCLPPAGLRKESKPPPIPQWWSAKQFSAWLTDSEETPRDIERMFESIRKPARLPTEICSRLLHLISVFLRRVVVPRLPFPWPCV